MLGFSEPGFFHYVYINMSAFVCPTCGNVDPLTIGMKNGDPYCRKCIRFRGEEIASPIKNTKTVGLHIPYSLSREQQVLSNRILENFKKGIDTLVYAVCGSGKTEISYGVIGYAMSKGLHVGFALPRRDVVIELQERIEQAFPTCHIVAVYGGHTEQLEGDCIILTTHQLYRYPNYFDLLVLDEIDAFPFKGNEVLQAFFEKSLRGHCLMMSATPSKIVVNRFKGVGKEILSLHTRFHKKPIPEPEFCIRILFTKYLFLVHLLKKYQKEKKPCLVFVPTIDISVSLSSLLSLFVKGGTYVHSKRADRSKVISDFKKGRYGYLVTTAVLERGVTIANCQVVVFRADHPIYDAATLIQIAGRAGRKANAPDGDVYFLAEKESEGMIRAKEEIAYCNTFLQGLHETF